MKNLIIPALLLIAIGGASFAQSAPSQPAPGASTPAASSPDASAPAASAPAASAPAASAPDAGAQAPGAPDAAAQAAPANPAASAPSFLEQELGAAASELSSGQVGSMTVEDIEKITAHLAIAVQKERYVQRVRHASFVLPGVGQFIAGDNLGGWLFVAWDVTVLAGTLLSAYFVLPANVQFGSLDYLNSPLSAIHTAWASNSLASYLPLAGVLAGGMILETVLRYVSADNAARTARKNIVEGKVTFQPTLDLMDGSLGVGMKMQY